MRQPAFCSPSTSRDFSAPFGNGSGTCLFGKNSDLLLKMGIFTVTFLFNASFDLFTLLVFYTGLFLLNN